MNIKIKGVEIEVTQAIHDYAVKKIYEALDKFITEENEKRIFVEVELSKTTKHHANGDMYSAAAKVKGLHRNIFIESIKNDLYASIDGLKDRLSETASQMKDKKKTLTHRVALRFKKLFKNQE